MKGVEIIGISGKSGSGKDFVGREVLRPAGYRRFSLAWPMKNEACGMGFSYEDVHFAKPPAVRAWLQKRGTEDGWMKHGENYWCDIAEAWMRTLHEEYGVQKFYVPDVRFLHEVSMVRRLGGALIRMELGDRPYPLCDTAAAVHSSETALDNYLQWDSQVLNKIGTTAESIRRQLVRDGVIPAPVERPHENQTTMAL